MLNSIWSLEEASFCSTRLLFGTPLGVQEPCGGGPGTLFGKVWPRKGRKTHFKLILGGCEAHFKLIVEVLEPWKLSENGAVIEKCETMKIVTPPMDFNDF